MKTATYKVTKIELNPDERDRLRTALEILREVNEVMKNTNDDNDYLTDSTDMSIYNSIYNEIDRIEEWLSVEA